MKEWYGILDSPEYAELDLSQAATDTPLEQLLLFDIETTGFSPKNSYCYMIGYCYVQNSIWHYRMLFNEDGRSEYAILQEFLQVLRHYQLLIHYNGDQFDIPFLTEKIRQYQSLGLSVENSSELSRLHSLDLYKIIKPYRQGLNLPNLKLTTIEHAMGFVRSDQYNGGELIHIYKEYLKTSAPELEQHLYQHNYEDILAMIPMLQLLNYTVLANAGCEQLHIDVLSSLKESASPSSDTREQERSQSQSDAQKSSQQTTKEQNAAPACIVLEFSLPSVLPFPYHIETQGVQIQCEYQNGRIIIPLIHAELRYYIPNYQDYYYLPIEDQVIHKSIAAYVDSAFKEKAKKNNCCLKKTGYYLPVPHLFKDSESLSSRLHTKNTEPPKFYQETPQSKNIYMEYEDSLIQDQTFFHAYIQALLT